MKYEYEYEIASHFDNPIKLLFTSPLHLIRAIARAYASTRATSLMRVKNSTHHLCLRHLIVSVNAMKKIYKMNKNMKFNS